MKFDAKKLALIFGTVLVAEYVKDRFVIKYGPNDSGFIEASDGFGLDEFAGAGVVAVIVYVGTQLLGKKG